MSKLTALIVDDEHLARQKIIRFLENRTKRFEIVEAENGIEALEKIPLVRPSLVFLDIQMPGLTGFEVLGNLEQRDFKLIFQTAYDEFAVKAFEENACDYLLKPFTEDRFNKALDRAISMDQTQRLTKFGTNKYLNQIVVKQGNKLQIVKTEDILCFVSRDHYTCIYTTTSSKEFISDLSLTHFEEHLCPKTFKRLHRNNIVQIGAIKNAILGENMEVDLSNGFRLPVSRNNRKTLKEIFQGE